jgi:hypothetical protein
MMNENRLSEAVDLGEEVQVRRRTGSAVVAVRMSTDLLRRIQEFAQGRGLTVSDVLRIGAEHAISQGVTTAVAYTLKTSGAVRYTTSREEYTEAVAAVGPAA